MADSIFPVPPTWATPQPIRRRKAASTPAEMPSTWRFDPDTGDIVVDGSGRVLVASPQGSAGQAAAFLVTVQRRSYTKVFSRTFGIDLEGILRMDLSHARIEPIIAQRMRQSARTDTRISDLEEFTYSWDADVITVGYTLVLSDGTRMRQKASLR